MLIVTYLQYICATELLDHLQTCNVVQFSKTNHFVCRLRFLLFSLCFNDAILWHSKNKITAFLLKPKF